MTSGVSCIVIHRKSRPVYLSSVELYTDFWPLATGHWLLARSQKQEASSLLLKTYLCVENNLRKTTSGYFEVK